MRLELLLRNVSDDALYPRFIAVRRNHRYRLVEVAHIDALVARGRTTRLLLADGSRILTSVPLVMIERYLGPHRFVRVSRRAVIRLDALVQLEPLHAGDLRLHLTGGWTVRTSRQPEPLLGILRTWCYQPRTARSA